MRIYTVSFILAILASAVCYGDSPDVAVSSETLAVLPSAQEEHGNDATALRSTLEINNELFNGHGSRDSYRLTTKVEEAINRVASARIEMPYVFDLSDDPNNRDRGWGDMLLRGAAVLKKTPRTGITGSCEFNFNTAEAANLGTGKNTVAPGVAFALANAYKDIMLTTFVQQKVSYSGDDSRNDFNLSKLQLTFDTAFKGRYWTQLQPTLYLDWENHQRTAGNLEFEAGTRLGGRWNLWIRPGVGLWGQGVTGGYNSYLQVGLRYVFGELLRQKFLNDLGALRKKLPIY